MSFIKNTSQKMIFIFFIILIITNGEPTISREILDVEILDLNLTTSLGAVEASADGSGGSGDEIETSGEGSADFPVSFSPNGSSGTLKMDEVGFLTEIYLPLTLRYHKSYAKADSDRYKKLASRIIGFIKPIIYEIATARDITVENIWYNFSKDKIHSQTTAKIFIFFEPAQHDVDLMRTLQDAIRESLEKLKIVKNVPFKLEKINVTNLQNLNEPIRASQGTASDKSEINGGYLAVHITASLFILIIGGALLYTFTNCKHIFSS